MKSEKIERERRQEYGTENKIEEERAWGMQICERVSNDKNIKSNYKHPPNALI